MTIPLIPLGQIPSLEKLLVEVVKRGIIWCLRVFCIVAIVIITNKRIAPGDSVIQSLEGQ
jgi:hypothetical protein